MPTTSSLLPASCRDKVHKQIQSALVCVVQEMLGHANPYITMGRYQHVPDELQRDAADRLDVVLNFAS